MPVMPVKFIKHVSEIPDDYKFKLWNTVIQNQDNYYNTDLFRYGQEAQDIVNSYKKFITDCSSNLLRIQARVFNPFEKFSLESFNWDDINYTFRIYFDLIYNFKGSKNKQKLDTIYIKKIEYLVLLMQSKLIYII